MRPGPEERLADPSAVRAEILATLRPLPPVAIPLADATGLVLCEPVIAPLDLPPFDNAAMDGYALRSIDVVDAPVRLRVTGRVFAGHPSSSGVDRGEAVSIATGAVVPAGADAVVAAEDVAEEGDRILVPHPVPAGRHVRKAGEDVRTGQIVLEAGVVLGPGQLAATAATGLARVSVHPRPRVAVVPTGDELRPDGTALETGQLYESVSVPLSALIAELGAMPLRHPIAPDDPQLLADAVEAAAAASDAVLTVGGVSMGERDLVREMGGQAAIRSFRLALRPAKPFAFGTAFGRPLFGLPGNPGAALASFEEMVRPALLALIGKRPQVRPAIRATLSERFTQPPGRLHLVRVEVWREGSALMARPAGAHGAGMIHTLARAMGWAVVPPSVEELPAGSAVDVRLLVEIP